MIKTVTQTCTDALRLIGQLWAPGSGPGPESLAEVTEFLNQMFDSWNVMRNSLYQVVDETFPLTSGQYIYTIGIGGNVNIPRPVKIDRMTLIYQTAPQILRLPIDLINSQQWAAIRVPDLPQAIPYKCYYDEGFSQTNPTGLGQLYFWPGPQAGYSVEMWAWVALPTTLQTTDTIYLPPGYAKALTYNLAIDIMPLYPKRLKAEQAAMIEDQAKESKRWVDALNSPSPIVSIDPALVGRGNNADFNWLESTN